MIMFQKLVSNKIMSEQPKIKDFDFKTKLE